MCIITDTRWWLIIGSTWSMISIQLTVWNCSEYLNAVASRIARIEMSSFDGGEKLMEVSASRFVQNLIWIVYICLYQRYNINITGYIWYDILASLLPDFDLQSSIQCCFVCGPLQSWIPSLHHPGSGWGAAASITDAESVDLERGGTNDYSLCA